MDESKYLRKVRRIMTSRLQ